MKTSPASRIDLLRNWLRSMRIATAAVVLLAAALSLESQQRGASAQEANAAAQCSYIIRPLSQSIASAGGTGALTVLTSGACTWTAVSNVPWITVAISSGSPLGQGRVNYTVFPNTAAEPRAGTVTVAGQIFTLNQEGNSTGACPVTTISTGQVINGALAPGDCLSPLRVTDGASPLADRYSFTGTAGQPAIISVTSQVDTFLYLLDGVGTVIAENDDTAAGASSRIPANSNFFILPATGTFIIEVTSFAAGVAGDYALSVTIPPGNCTYSLAASGQAVAADGGNGVVTVNTQAGCSWSAASNDAWLTLGASGISGQGAANFTVAPNPGVARTGSLTVAGQTFTVLQAGTNGQGCPVAGTVTPQNGAQGTVISIAGTNFTGVSGLRFPNNVMAQFTVVNDTLITGTVPAGAVTGPLTIIKPTCANTQTASFTVNGLVTTVSAANFIGVSIASESIAAAFGSSLATGLSLAQSVPLPTTMLGTSVKVRDSSGTERTSALFFVAPQQINYQIPQGTLPGDATVIVTSGDGTISSGPINITAVAPGLFTANATGRDATAGDIIRVKQGGAQSTEPVATFDVQSSQFVTANIDFGPDAGPASDELYLVIYGTGIRFRSTENAVVCKIGGLPVEILYAGPHGTFVGLDQINIHLPRSLKGKGEVDIILTVDGKPSNTARIKFK